MTEPTTPRPEGLPETMLQPVEGAFLDDCEPDPAPRPDEPSLRSSIPPHQQAGYDAVYEVICSTPGDARRNASIWRAVEAYRTASEAGHARQVRERAADEARQQTLRDLDAGDITPEELTAAGLDPGHVVDLRADGWTLQHPLTCRTDLFACPVNRAAERDLVEPPGQLGQFECGAEDGEFWIGETR